MKDELTRLLKAVQASDDALREAYSALTNAMWAEAQESDTDDGNALASCRETLKSEVHGVSVALYRAFGDTTAVLHQAYEDIAQRVALKHDAKIASFRANQGFKA